MTDEQINEAITQATGLWDYPYSKTKRMYDFCSDLNAMHEAEQQLWNKDWNLRYDFIDELGKLLQPTVWHRMNATDTLDATARQRAEAFLRTLGKWDDQSGDATEMVKEGQK